MNAPPTIPPELANNPEYENLEELGRGGMGVVYKVRNALMGRDEVLKVMGHDVMSVPGAIDRFRQEIQSAARLDHPNIVRAYSARLLGDLLVFSMEFVPGVDLESLVRSRGPLQVVNACYYAQQAANGLQHAHEKGMVHRDVKPANLILHRDGKRHMVKILDFGLAKITSERGYDSGLTGANTMLGTPDFIAPEQIVDAQSADTRADIYSLGCTIYFLLTGSPPFVGKSLYELLSKHQNEPPTLLTALRPDVNEELAGVVAKMMAKDPSDRFQTSGEVAKALGAFVTKSGVASNPPRQDLPAANPPPTSAPLPDGSQTAVPTATRIIGFGKSKPPATSQSMPAEALPVEPAEALPAEAIPLDAAEALPADGNVWSSQTIMPVAVSTSKSKQSKLVPQPTERTREAAERERERYEPPPAEEQSGGKKPWLVLGIGGAAGLALLLVLGLWLGGVFSGKDKNGTAADGVPTYTIKRAAYRPGSNVFVKSSNKTTVTTNNKTEDVEADKSDYVEQVLEEADGKPTKIKRTYRNAQVSRAGGNFGDLAFSGRVVLIDATGALPSFSISGRVLSRSEAKQLATEFDEHAHAGSDFLFPRTPVKVGETWRVDKDRLLEMNRGKEVKFDVDKSSIDMKLAKVYAGSDDTEWALLEGTIALTPADPKQIPDVELGTITGAVTIDLPTNGRSADRSLTSRLSIPAKKTQGAVVTFATIDSVYTQTIRVELDPDDVRNIIPQLSESEGPKRLAGIKRLVATKNVKAAVPELLNLLDDRDERVSAAAAEALATVVAPSKADLDYINAALEKDGKNARLYAIRFYASDPARKVPESLVPTIVGLLADKSADIRKSGIRILSHYGPGCKSKALPAVLEHLADADPTVAAEAARLFASFGPFNEADRAVLSARLAHAKSRIRLAAATVLATEAPDAAKAQEWFQPRLKDEDAQVRMMALAALAKWGPKSKDSLPDVLKLFDDDTTSVAVAAVKTAAAIDSGTAMVKELSRLLKPAESRSEVKAAAMELLLSFDLMDVEVALPFLTALLDADQPQMRATALAKIGKFGKTAKSSLPTIIGRLKDPDERVKIAALQVIAPFGPDAADAVPAVAALLDGKQPDGVAIAAAETLGKLGPKSIAPLTRALLAKLPKDALVMLCEGLGNYGKDAATAGPALLEAVMQQKDLRTLMESATPSQPWSPDPVAAALARVGTDSIIEPLTKLTNFQKKVGQKPVADFSDEVMLWGIQVLGSLNPDLLTDKGKDQVAARLDFLSKNAPSQKCKDAAKAVKVKFPLKK